MTTQKHRNLKLHCMAQFNLHSIPNSLSSDTERIYRWRGMAMSKHRENNNIDSLLFFIMNEKRAVILKMKVTIKEIDYLKMILPC